MLEAKEETKQMEAVSAQFEAMIRRTRPMLKKSSLKTYLQKLTRLLALLKCTSADSVKCLQNTGKIIAVLQAQPKLSTRLNSITIAIIAQEMFDPSVERSKAIEELTKQKNAWDQEYMKERIAQQKNVKEEKNWVSWEELDKVVRGLQKEYKDEPSKTRAMRYLIGLLYVNKNDLPPRRNVFITCSYYDGKKYTEIRGNYYDATEKQLVLNDYKTNRSHGRVVFKFKKNSRLVKAIKTYRRWNKTDHFLVYNETNKPISSSQMTALLYDIFSPTGKKISSSMLRKIYISERFEDDEVYRERAELAKKMGHTVAMQASWYEKK